MSLYTDAHLCAKRKINAVERSEDVYKNKLEISEHSLK